MHSKPVIFISAVSGELKGARQLVANTLTFLGYEPDWQDIFGAEQGDLRGMLRRRIDASAGVVQLVGKCHGFEPHAADGVSPLPDAQFGRVSYTQYEALYAKQRGKPVWYLFLGEDFPTDPHDPEPDDIRRLQDAYRERVGDAADLHHSANTPDALQISVYELRNELAQLRRSARRHAALVLVLLLLLAGGIAWVLHQQHESAHSAEQTKKDAAAAKGSADKAERAATAALDETVKLRESVNAFAGVKARVQQAEPGQKPEEVEEKTYEELAKQFGLDAKLLRKKLPGFAEELRHAPDATTMERANAAYIAKNYAQAETFALSAAQAALGAVSPRTAEAIQAYELAGQAAKQRIHYTDALHHLREAGYLTDRQRNPREWARVQFILAQVLVDDGDYQAAGVIFQEVVKEQTVTRGPNDPATLLSRLWLGIALVDQGRNLEAEQELRAVITLETRYQGMHHPDTLKARNNLANALNRQGKFSDAEREHRAVLALCEGVLGSEHPETLASRSNLAGALQAQGKHAEAEQEHRAVLALRKRVLGPEHPETLKSRHCLAIALSDQGKHAEAEVEYRAVIWISERVLGHEHPDVLLCYYNFALALEDQEKYSEALDFAKRAEEGRLKILGPEHAGSKDAKTMRQRIQGKLSKSRIKLL